MKTCEKCNLAWRDEIGAPVTTLFDSVETGRYVEHDCALALQKVMREMLHQIGQPDICRGCGKSIFWVRHLNGKHTPYTPSGLNHFIDCPKREQFGKAERGGK